jgi:predicted molibdopterin-dependent oxidoreductase YjgC
LPGAAPAGLPPHPAAASAADAAGKGASNATTAAAHFVLPGCAHVEKRGTFVNVKGRVQKFMRAVEAPGDARPEWEFLHELVHHVTGQNGFSTIEGLFNQMAREVPGFAGLEWAKLGDTGVTVQI